ncbi:proline iminopeptidase-family hydrolase [Reichenbachiella sp.]|uniref:proline iminopeptidase-family hydrolase n=1 Tax=Reichenbachiella sp. TaxID=2184521 RepID=UPI00329755C3
MNKSKIPGYLSIFFIAGLINCQTPSLGLKSGEGYVGVKGGKIWYRVLGEGNQTPLLMLHGGPGGTSRSFYLFEPLTADRPIILMDQLGSGRSDQHEDTTLLTVDNFVEQVAALRTALRLKEFYLHGHSWGTALALEYYDKYPDGVKAIIFNSPYFNTALWESDADTLISTLPDSIQMAIRVGEETQEFTSFSYLQADTVFSKNFGRRKEKLVSPLDTVEAPRNNFIYSYMWGPTEFTATGTLKNYDNMESLERIEVPTLFITGEYDEARPKTVSYFQSLVPNAQMEVVEGAGHGTMHDNLEQNTGIIKKFLNQLEGK